LVHPVLVCTSLQSISTGKLANISPKQKEMQIAQMSMVGRYIINQSFKISYFFLLAKKNLLTAFFNMSVKEFNTHIITKLLYSRQQQEQAFKSQASWGRLELRPT
jgi:hypothetical protein